MKNENEENKMENENKLSHITMGDIEEATTEILKVAIGCICAELNHRGMSIKKIIDEKNFY